MKQITSLWQQGAIIRSWILELLTQIFERDEEFHHTSGEVAHGPTVEWALKEAKKSNVLMPIIEESLKIRDESIKTGGTYSTKLIALLRHEFGGHAVKTTDSK